MFLEKDFVEDLVCSAGASMKTRGRYPRRQLAIAEQSVTISL